MANFEIASKITGVNEGGYSNNPNDHGGETYAGISRKFWEEWDGWAIIDKYKSDGIDGLDSRLKSDLPLQQSVQLFYRQNFWNPNKLDQINNQQVANNVYDCGVNCGVTIAAKMLQKACGVNADGVIGPQTIAAANEYDPKAVFEALNIMRREYYENLATRPAQHQFLASWLSRLVEYQSN